MTDIQGLRSSILQQIDTLGTKRRFGLFSQPISNAICDDGQYKTKLHARNQTGKPITQPRNFYTNPTKQGQLAYFQKLKCLATSDVKDQFVQQRRRLLQQQISAYNNGRKQSSFYSSSNYKSITNAAYEYVQEKNPQSDPKRFRQSDGKVKSMSRNFYTNPLSKIDRSLFKHFEHITDPYDRRHNMEMQLQKKAKAKQAEQAFKPNNVIPKLLNPNKTTYFVDDSLKTKIQKQPKFNIYKHEVPFRRSSPMKSGHKGFIQPFPKYIQDPPNQIKRKEASENKKQTFKSMNSSLSKPCPSISMMTACRSFHNRSFSFNLRRS